MRKNVLLLTFIFVIMLVTGCGDAGDVKVYESSTEAAIPHEEQTITAVISKIDMDKNVIGFIECISGETHELIYNGGVNVTNTHGDTIDISSIGCGDIVDATYYADTQKLTSIAENSKSSKKEKVTKFAINMDSMTATYKGTSCNVAEYVSAYDDGASLDPREISTEDQVTLNFFGDKLMSIVVELGHGYVSLSNQDTYVGGMVEIGYDVIVPVTNNMLLEVREGTYTLRISNRGFENSMENIVVTKGEKTEVNLASIAIPRGTMTFNIEPAEAQLYVDGVLQSAHAYSNLYGTYKVKVTCDGYEDYSSSFTISDTVQNTNITMTEETTEESEDTEDTTESTTTTTTEATTTEATTTTTASTDTGCTVTVNTPTNVGVYVDGEYVGMSPVTFAKKVGTHTVTLYKTGYIIKSYTISCSDDGNNDTYSFEDLVSVTDAVEASGQ